MTLGTFYGKIFLRMFFLLPYLRYAYDKCTYVYYNLSYESFILEVYLSAAFVSIAVI